MSCVFDELSLDEQIVNQKAIVATLRVDLKKAEEQLNELEQKKGEADLKKIRSALVLKGVSHRDVLKALSYFVDKDFDDEYI